ncbi:hypothetical protein KSP39_PZI007311 [Platanthera zijinensis]|uniref:SWIM-type domain-containing protein n=1 Tax=Platanthera zijinensis TaxID=2320716 RepID=A0AAP0BT64_9ASPA
MLMLQHSEIRRAFGQSTIQLNKEFSGPLYFELVGRVSSTALDLIKKEEVLAKNGCVDVCNCTHRCRHASGLPCAHDLVAYMSNANSFPLWMIHNHWKQLTLDNNVTNENIKVEVVNESEIDIEMEGILKRYKNTSALQKQEIKKKLRDIMNPTSTQTLEPKLPKAMKGRPRGSCKKFKDDAKSTKRNPSLFEYVLMDEQLLQAKSKLHPKQNVVLKESIMLRIVQREMSPCVSEFVTDVIDVLADGHCGYRVVSNAMGMGTDWMNVRKQLSLELQSRENIYDNIFGKERRLVLLSSLDCNVSPAPYDKWMSMPDIGLVVASCYNIAFVHLSRYQSFTLLPLHSPPPASPKIACVVDGCSKGVGNLLYTVATKFPGNALKHRPTLLEYIVSSKPVANPPDLVLAGFEACTQSDTVLAWDTGSSDALPDVVPPSPPYALWYWRPPPRLQYGS